MNNCILVFGDSIVWGAWDSKGGWANRLKNYTDNQAIDNQMENYNTVYPLGVNGDNTDGLLQRFETELNNRLHEDSNVVVLIAIGINDSQFTLSNNENQVSVPTFKSNLLKMIKATQNKVKHIVLVGLTPVDDSLLNPMPWDPTQGYNNINVKKYNETIKEIVKEKNLSFIDLYKLFSEKDYKKLLVDGLHPNTNGHEMIYKKVIADLRSLKILE